MILYVKIGCPWCRLAEAYLDERGYKYQRLDVRRDPEAFQELKRISGQSYTPTLVLKICSWPISDPMSLKIF
jgi:glutaredoxin